VDDSVRLGPDWPVVSLEGLTSPFGFVSDPSESDPPAESVDLSVPLSAPTPAFAPAFVEAAARRSFFAQPEPLKWTAGTFNALRIGPPQTGHAAGPLPWIPWTTSIRCPQSLQT